jgi:release factor glutamine methyltransferase
VHDVGTGSGCIAIALAKMRPDLDVRASDVSADVAPVFSRNCVSILGRELPFTVADGAEGIATPVELIVSNPPYLTAEEVAAMKQRNWPEPESALLGGEDGLAVPRSIIRGAFGALADDGYLLLEAASWQMPALADILVERGFSRVRIHADLGGRERVIEAQRIRTDD